MSQRESFFVLARRLCYATRFLGVNGFAFPPRRGKGMKLHINGASIAAVAVPACLMILLDILKAVIALQSNSSSSYSSKGSDAFDKAKFMFLQLMVRVESATNVILDVKNRLRIWSIICGMCDFDIVLEKKICGRAKYNRLSQLFHFLTVILMSSILVAIVESIAFYKPGAIYFLFVQTFSTFLYRTNVVANATMLQVYIHHVWIRYKVLNENLRVSFKLAKVDGSLDSSLLNAEIGERPKNIQIDQMVRNTARLHLKLSDIIGHINHCFWFQFIQLSFKVFIFVLNSCYEAYRYFLSPRPNKVDGSYLAYLTLYSLYYLYFVIVNADYGSNINSENHKTAFIVNKAMNKSQKDKLLLTELKQFLQQLEHSDPHLSCGIFHIGWNLVFEGAGAIVAYIATLIQYDVIAYNIQKSRSNIIKLSTNQTISQ